MMKNRRMIRIMILSALALWPVSCITSLRHEKIPVTTGSESARLLYDQADALFEKVYIPQAVDLLGGALAEDPGFFMAAYGLATHHIYSEDKGAFMKYAEQAVQAEIKLSKGEFLLKTALQKLLQDQDADVTEAGKELVKLYPKDPDPYDSKGDYFMAIEEYGSAYESFMKAYEIDSTWTGSLRKAERARTMTDLPGME
jgi:tetratricopeptide (TPR) repeat protein